MTWLDGERFVGLSAKLFTVFVNRSRAKGGFKAFFVSLMFYFIV